MSSSINNNNWCHRDGKGVLLEIGDWVTALTDRKTCNLCKSNICRCGFEKLTVVGFTPRFVILRDSHGRRVVRCGKNIIMTSRWHNTTNVQGMLVDEAMKINHQHKNHVVSLEADVKEVRELLSDASVVAESLKEDNLILKREEKEARELLSDASVFAESLKEDNLILKREVKEVRELLSDASVVDLNFNVIRHTDHN